MPTYSKIPTIAGRPQKQRVTLQTVTYTLLLNWNDWSECWVLDIYDSTGVTALVTGLAVVTGADLLGQLAYLDVASQAALMIMSTGPGVSPDEVPTFENLGTEGQIIYVSP